MRLLEAAEQLGSHLEDRRGEQRDVIVAYFGNGRSLIAAVADLSPEALEAAREYACVVRETFGEYAERGFEEAVPQLVELVDFPATCESDGVRKDEQPEPEAP